MIYIMIYETRHLGIVAQLSTLRECRLATNDETIVVYCFAVKEPVKEDIIYIKYHLYEYSCLDITKYEYGNKENDDYYTISINELKNKHLINLSIN